MKTLFTLCFALLSTTVFAAGEFVDYQVNGKPYQGYMMSPAADAPLILMIHDWDGLTDYEVKRANMLSGMGYAVFAADLFGKGIRPTELKDKQEHTGALYKNRKKMRELIKGALTTAKSKGANIDNAVSMGYCFGGAAVLEHARSGDNMKGFVSFHGGLSTPEGQDYTSTKGKLLILHGSADTHITLQDFATLGTELETQGVAHEMITYSGAPHAFTVFGSAAYREDADKKSWLRFSEYLKETL